MSAGRMLTQPTPTSSKEFYMIKAKAYKVKDFPKNFGAEETEAAKASIPATPTSDPVFDLRMLGGIVEDFNNVRSALRTFPFKSAFSLVGLGAVLYVAFKVGQNFGIIQARFKGKGK